MFQLQIMFTCILIVEWLYKVVYKVIMDLVKVVLKREILKQFYEK